jgi:hypothetical protein
MSRPINLSGYATAILNLWHTIPSIESGYDFCRVYVDNAPVWSSDSTTPGWTEVSISLTPFVGGVHLLRFEFFSDASVQAEGWYLDDILITGMQWAAAVAPAIASIQPAAASNQPGTLRLHATAPAGMTLALQAAASLEQNQWAEVSNPVLSSGSGVDFSVALELNAPQRFFRLRALPGQVAVQDDGKTITIATAAVHAVSVGIGAILQVRPAAAMAAILSCSRRIRLGFTRD